MSDVWPFLLERWTLDGAKIDPNPVETSQLICSVFRQQLTSFALNLGLRAKTQTSLWADKLSVASRTMDSRSDTSKSIALPAGLDTMPGEILTKILTFTMASDTPVYFWLLQLARNGESHKGGIQRSFRPRAYLFPRILWGSTLSADQDEHYSDWRIATSISRRMRKSGIPAFFREKTFLVRHNMLADLIEGEYRSSTYDMAVDMIEKIVVPIGDFKDPVRFIALPKYHFFTQLKTLTIDAGWSIRRIRDNQTWSTGTTRYPPPKELLDLLACCGLRQSETELRIVTSIKDVSEVNSLIRSLERNVYPILRQLGGRRTGPEDPYL